MVSIFVILAGLLSCGSILRASPNISEVDRFGYFSNAGWVDFRGHQDEGVVASDFCLGGYAYAANLGWINFGDQDPENGYEYGNTDGMDFGVNVDQDGGLTGYAYGGNIGWLLFEQSEGKPRLDFSTGKLRGFVWAPNVGWLNFEDGDVRVTALVRVDGDGDGISDAWEYRHFGSRNVANFISDYDHDGQSDLAEYRAGTDPRLAQSRFRILSQAIDPAAGLASLTFQSNPGRLYRIYRTDHPVASWSPVSADWSPGDPGESSSRSFSFPPGSRHFFRVESALPLSP
ncbi:hypothetical protein [Luteolibacter marinus]|uniref:hypothetical protein n=1 Tax=Luteolibacter marinus TaxID=2776705 RepID=UPI0018671FD3|nr:hypothetical protein [Luteolibacter marinus]